MSRQVGFQPPPKVGDATPGARGSTTTISGHEDAPDTLSWEFRRGQLAVVYCGDDGTLRELDHPRGLEGMTARQRAIATGLLEHVLHRLRAGEAT